MKGITYKKDVLNLLKDTKTELDNSYNEIDTIFDKIDDIQCEITSYEIQYNKDDFDNLQNTIASILSDINDAIDYLSHSDITITRELYLDILSKCNEIKTELVSGYPDYINENLSSLEDELHELLDELY